MDNLPMTTMSTRPLPAIQDDPAFAAATAARSSYTAEAARVRGDFTLSDLGRAEQITELWQSANDAISAAYNNLTARRRQRLAELEALVPVGPNIPADATLADQTFLGLSFRATLNQARENAADEGALLAMLADAEKFNEDQLRRAVLTVCVESGQVRIVQAWCDQRGLSAELAELIAVRSDLAGYGDLASHLFEQQAFTAIPAPDEVSALPGLKQAAAVTAQQAARTGNIGRSWH